MGDWGYLVLKIGITIAVILALTGVIYWLVRRYAAIGLGGIGRGRAPRLAVVDALNVDRRRRLLLVRRDNVEHLILIGGPSDIVVEPAIVRVRRQTARPQAQASSAPAAESPIVHDLARSGLGEPSPPVMEPPATVAAAPTPVFANVERLEQRSAPSYRPDHRPGAGVETRQMFDSFGEPPPASAELPFTEPQPAPPVSPPVYGRDFRVVQSDAEPEPPPSSALNEPTLTKISDLEQEMARLLGQLNVKRP